ncbi:hypothetical protein GCM10027284_44920 [Cyclobacterium sediminis]
MIIKTSPMNIYFRLGQIMVLKTLFKLTLLLFFAIDLSKERLNNKQNFTKNIPFAEFYLMMPRLFKQTGAKSMALLQILPLKYKKLNVILLLSIN